MDKVIVVERSHRGLMQRKPGDKAHTIIAKLHNERDTMDILRKTPDRSGWLHYNSNPIAIFLDHTANIAKAWAAFTDVRKMLRGRWCVRFGILFPARLHISHKNEEKEFLDTARNSHPSTD